MRSLPRLSLTVILSVCSLIACLLPPTAWAKLRIRDASLLRSLELYEQVPCLTEEELDFGREVLKGLDYISQRAFRQMCMLPDIDFSSSRLAWSELLRLRLSYEQLLCFEKWCRLPGVTMQAALEALPEIKKLGYEAGRSFQAFLGLQGTTPLFAIKTIRLLTGLKDANNRALQGMLAITGMDASQAMDGLVILARLRPHQARAAEAFARLADMDTTTLLDGLALIRQLREDDAWNAHTLFRQKVQDRATGWAWLVRYFATPPPVQEAQFYRQEKAAKKQLLQAFYDGGEELIWKINNLHAITDRFGFEISISRLKRFSLKELQGRFEQFSPQVRFRFGNRFYGALTAGNRKQLISILRQATAAERVQTAKDLTSANIYALLAQGSELYDSSFRDILVPVLKDRIMDTHQGNLLEFLQAIDPDNMLVASFIVSLAQKGKLTTFFPADSQEQESILDLVAASAFKNEDAILLFSATFMRLLEVLEPGARTFLIRRMADEADGGTAAFSRLISVIMQYYLEEYPELLGQEDKGIITRLIVRHGAVNLNRYLQTPFAQWKADGRLASVSVFHPDDDGRDSFLSNARALQKNGYRLALSPGYTFHSLSDAQTSRIRDLIRLATRKPGKGLPALFHAMQRDQVAVAFVKSFHGLEISHTSYIYANEAAQERMMKQFLLSGDEMFAQRGHSYWRSEQITDPLLSLLKKGEITSRDLRARQRFLSLGSCGGVKAYTKLTRLFCGKVDILATIGTGLAMINNPYNRNFFEIVAASPATISWKDVARQSRFIFAGGRGRDYLQPGSLTAILHKILDEEQHKEGPPAKWRRNSCVDREEE